MRTCERCSEPIPEGVRPHARFCSRNCQKRAHDEAIIGACRDCGKGLSRHSMRAGSAGRCDGCNQAAKGRRVEARARIIADMWEDGMSRKEIAADLGWTTTHVSVEFDRIRRRHPGLLPYRYKLSNPRAQAA